MIDSKNDARTVDLGAFFFAFWTPGAAASGGSGFLGWCCDRLDCKLTAVSLTGFGPSSDESAGGSFSGFHVVIRCLDAGLIFLSAAILPVSPAGTETCTEAAGGPAP